MAFTALLLVGAACGGPNFAPGASSVLALQAEQTSRLPGLDSTTALMDRHRIADLSLSLAPESLLTASVDLAEDIAGRTVILEVTHAMTCENNSPQGGAPSICQGGIRSRKSSPMEGIESAGYEPLVLDAGGTFEIDAVAVAGGECKKVISFDIWDLDPPPLVNDQGTSLSDDTVLWRVGRGTVKAACPDDPTNPYEAPADPTP